MMSPGPAHDMAPFRPWGSTPDAFEKVVEGPLEEARRRRPRNQLSGNGVGAGADQRTSGVFSMNFDVDEVGYSEQTGGGSCHAKPKTCQNGRFHAKGRLHAAVLWHVLRASLVEVGGGRVLFRGLMLGCSFAVFGCCVLQGDESTDESDDDD